MLEKKIKYNYRQVSVKRESNNFSSQSMEHRSEKFCLTKDENSNTSKILDDCDVSFIQFG